MSSRPLVTVRPVRWEDLADLRETYLELYAERDSGEPIGITLFERAPSMSDEVAWFDRMFRRVLEGEELFLVAEVDGHVVGSCSIGMMSPGPSSEQSHVGELGILVRREFRGKGVGTALLERAVTDARARFELVYLSVFSINERARRLYERFGFTVCGHLPRIVKRSGRYFDEERMVLDFTGSTSRAGANR